MTQEKHPQLSGLKALWNHPDETLNRVLWAFSPADNPDGLQGLFISAEEKEVTIGHACAYLDFMNAVAETKEPSEAWVMWCEHKDIKDQIRNNPFVE